MDFEERTVEYGYLGWPVIVPVVFPDGSERAEGGSKTPFFHPGPQAPFHLAKRSNPCKKILGSCCDSEL